MSLVWYLTSTRSRIVISGLLWYMMWWTKAESIFTTNGYGWLWITFLPWNFAPSRASRKYFLSPGGYHTHVMGSFRWRMQGGIAPLRIHVICLDNTLLPKRSDKICMMTTKLACNRAVESSYWRMDNDPDVGLLTGYVLCRLPVELEFMDLNTFPCWFGLRPSPRRR
jgi:hypothetical protein